MRLESRAARARHYFYGPSGGLAPAVLRLRYSEVSVFKGAAGMRAPSTALPIGMQHTHPAARPAEPAVLHAHACSGTHLCLRVFGPSTWWGAVLEEALAGRAGWQGMGAVHYHCAAAVYMCLQFRMSNSRGTALRRCHFCNRSAAAAARRPWPGAAALPVGHITCHGAGTHLEGKCGRLPVRQRRGAGTADAGVLGALQWRPTGKAAAREQLQDSTI